MTNPQLERHIAGTYAPTGGSANHVQGAVQQVDTVGREITVLLSTGIAVFDVPPDCPIFLHVPDLQSKSGGTPVALL
jgi:hypothetical protein